MIAGSKTNTEEELHLASAGVDMRQERRAQGATFKRTT